MKKGLFPALSLWFCALSVLLFAFPSKLAAAEISENIELPFRTNDSTTFVLGNYAGQILLFEFFYSWCPHCQAATPKIHSDIIDYYNARGGNNDGLPVTVIYVNLESRSGSYQTDTDNFIAANAMHPVLDDFAREAFSLYGPSRGGTPRMVIINGVANSPTHEQWEVVHRGDGYSATTTINTLKSKIDSIRAPNTSPRLVSPRILANGDFELTINGQRGRTNHILGSSNWVNWTTITNLITTNGTAVFRTANPGVHRYQFFRAQVQ